MTQLTFFQIAVKLICYVRSLRQSAPTTVAAQHLTDTWSSVSNCLVKTKNLGHDISQAYGAVAHVKRTWETIDNSRGAFLFQIGRQPVEQMGSRLPVRTAAESGFTLEHIKKIYPNNWQDAAMYFGLEVAV